MIKQFLFELLGAVALMGLVMIALCVLEDVGLIQWKVVTAWYDCWVGWCWDRKQARLYIFPLPMIGLCIEEETEHRLKRIIASHELFNAWLQEKGVDAALNQSEYTHVRNTVQWLPWLEEKEMLREAKRTIGLRLMRQ